MVRNPFKEKVYAASDVSFESANVCKCCKGKCSLLEKCNTFLEMNIIDRWMFMKDKFVCYSCLRSGHRKMFCPERKLCGVEHCKKKHNKLLHLDTSSDSDSGTKEDGTKLVAQASSSQHQTILKIVPVYLKTSTQVIKTYAILDSASTVTIMNS